MLARVLSRPPAFTRLSVRSLGLCTALVLAICVQAVPVAGAAVGAGSSFSELTEAQQTSTTAVATAATTEGSSSGNSTGVIVIALIAAVILLMVIAFVIIRDARRRAPVSETELTGGTSARDQAARLRARRAKAKAARRQRKRNR